MLSKVLPDSLGLSGSLCSDLYPFTILPDPADGNQPVYLKVQHDFVEIAFVDVYAFFLQLI